MRAFIVAMTVVAVSLAASAIGCGGEREERGLAPPNEEAVPMNPGEMRETEQQRSEQQQKQDEKAEDKDFDQAAEPGSGS